MLECDLSSELGRLFSPQINVVFFVLLAYIGSESPTLVLFDLRLRFVGEEEDLDNLSGHYRDKPPNLLYTQV